jgi:hypothetical protein
MMDKDRALATVAARLGDLVDQVAFLGGAVVSFLVTDAGAFRPRETDDVDLIVRAETTIEYSLSLRVKLVARGFHEDPESSSTCRWIVDGIPVDIMPPVASVLGFTNRWYTRALATAVPFVLDGGEVIKVVTAPYFIATKLVAFNDRGRGDYLESRDLSDIVDVIDGREALPQELLEADDEVRAFIASEVGCLLNEPAFLEALPGLMQTDEASQARLPLLLARLRAIAAA